MSEWEIKRSYYRDLPDAVLEADEADLRQWMDEAKEQRAERERERRKLLDDIVAFDEKIARYAGELAVVLSVQSERWQDEGEEA